MYYGATYLLERFADELGLTSDLKACFPDTYKKLLSIAFYLILEGDNPLYRFEKWHLTHKHPYVYTKSTSKRNAGFTFIIITALTKVLMLNRHLFKELPVSFGRCFNFKKLVIRFFVAFHIIAIKEARHYLGYFVLISNEKMDAFTALHLYRMKDVVEKVFGNLKERLNMRRLLASSEKGLDGKIFVEFIALILIELIRHKEICILVNLVIEYVYIINIFYFCKPMLY